MNRPGNNSYRKNRNAAAAGEPVARVRTPNIRDGEVFGTVTSLLGGSRFTVCCMDSITRMCRIKGKMKKRMWVREGDIVIVAPWDIQDEKGDVIWRYTGPQVEWLRRKGYLNAPDA